MRESTLHRIYILLLVIAADIYVVLPWIKPSTVLNYAVVLILLMHLKRPIPPPIRTLLTTYYALLFYLFVILLLRNEVRESFSILLAAFPLPLIFLAFVQNAKCNQLVLFYAKSYLVYNGIFSLLQVLGIHTTAGELLSNIPFVFIDNTFIENLGGQGLRISGAGYSTIGLACNIGLIFLIFYYSKNKPDLLTNNERKLYLVLLAVLALFTQTRSLLFTLPLVILIVNLAFSTRNRLRKIGATLLGGFVFSSLVYISLPLIEQNFPRLLLSIEQDGSVIHRIQANVYGVVGTIHLSPLTGVSFDRGLEAIRIGYREVGLFVGYYFIDQLTHHNQPAYYFRYFGLIGLTLFISIYFQLIRLSKRVVAFESDRKLLVALVIFHFLYTLTHNNKITMDLYFWILLAINQYQATNVQYPAKNTSIGQ